MLKIFDKATYVDGFFLLWTIFHIMSFYKISGSGVFLIVINVWALYDCVMVHHKCERSKYVTIFDVFTAMLVLYGLYFWLFGEHYAGIANRSYILKVWGALLPFYSLYRASRNGKLTEGKIIFWSFLFFLCAYLDYQRLLMNKLSSIFNGEGEVVNNGSYLILGLVPLIGLIKKRYIQVAAFLFCFFFIITAYKRGPILMLSCCLLYYIILTMKWGRNKIWIILLGAIAYFVMLEKVTELLASSDILQYKLEQTLEGDSSHRDEIRQGLTTLFLKSSFLEQLFGHGAYSTVGLFGRMAHNDWLEILFNQGIIGFVIHAVFCWNIIVVWKKTEKKSPIRLSMGMFTIIYIMTSFLSMAYDCIPIYEMVIFAMSVALLDNRELLKKRIRNTNI